MGIWIIRCQYCKKVYADHRNRRKHEAKYHEGFKEAKTGKEKLTRSQRYRKNLSPEKKEEAKRKARERWHKNKHRYKNTKYWEKDEVLKWRMRWKAREYKKNFIRNDPYKTSLENEIRYANEEAMKGYFLYKRRKQYKERMKNKRILAKKNMETFIRRNRRAQRLKEIKKKYAK